MWKLKVVADIFQYRQLNEQAKPLGFKCIFYNLLVVDDDDDQHVRHKHATLRYVSKNANNNRAISLLSPVWRPAPITVFAYYSTTIITRHR